MASDQRPPKASIGILKDLGTGRGGEITYLKEKINPRLPVIGRFLLDPGPLGPEENQELHSCPFSEVLQAHQHGPLEGLRWGVGAFLLPFL